MTAENLCAYLCRIATEDEKYMAEGRTKRDSNYWKAALLISHLIEVLEDIADPMVALRREAERTGGTIDGMNATTLCNHAHWLRDKAHTALAQADAMLKEREKT